MKRAIGPESKTPPAIRTSWVTRSLFLNTTRSPATLVERGGSKNLPGIVIVVASARRRGRQAEERERGGDHGATGHGFTR